MIYADHAATTRLDPEALDAMRPFLTDEYANPSQSYSFSRTAKKALLEARETIAQCIHASPEEIIFTSGGTESDNWAVKGIASVPRRGRSEFLCSAIEHHAVLRPFEELKKRGASVSYLQPTGQGVITTETLRSKSNEKTQFVSVMLANNEVGTIEPVRALCQIAHKDGAWFHTDAVQAVGHIPVNVQTLGVDLLSASAHKFHGPKGVGFLYIRNGTDLASLLVGGSQEKGKRAGTENIAGIVGMASALKRSCSFIEKEQERLRDLEEVFLKNLGNIPYLRNGASEHLPGHISISFRNIKGEILLHRLDLMGICVSTGSACDSQNTQLSHVLRTLKLPKEYAYGTIRITFGRENKEKDAVQIAVAIGKIIAG